jgi:ketosteroid isomerase-like protein
MTNTIVAVLAYFVLSNAAMPDARLSSQTKKSGAATDSAQAMTAEFHRLAEQWRQIYNGKDATKFATMYAEDAQYISAHVAGYVADGREAVIANFQRGMDSSGAIESIEVLSSKTSCDLATVVCKYIAVNAGQRVEGRNLLVLKKHADKWLIASHITVVKD